MKTQKLLVAVLLFVGLASLPLICGAEVDSGITDALNNIVTDAAVLLVAICTLFIIYGAILMLTAAGAADKISTGKTIIVWAAAGLMVGLLAGPIASTVSSWVS